MWRCPKCQSKVDDSFEICWSCGATADGVEDPSFVTADDAEPIEDEPVPEGSDVDDPFADFAGTPMPELVDCYTAENTIEAKFIADQLMEAGIPAVADRNNVNLALGGFRPEMWGCGPRVWIRKDDLYKATAWLQVYDERKSSRQKSQD